MWKLNNNAKPMRIFLLCISILFITSCNYHKNKNVSPKENLQDISFIKEGNKIIILSISALQGVWAEKEGENAIFFIRSDSLFYTESQENPVQIKLSGDTILIMGDVPVHCKVLKLTKDSLWYKDEFNEETTKLYKRRQNKTR
jgi:hypothetical protein